MKDLKHIGFSFIFMMVSFAVIFLFPQNIITNSEPISSPYYKDIEKLLKKDFLSPAEYQEFQSLNEKNKQWFQSRRELQLKEENSVENMNKFHEDIGFSYFLNIKSTQIAYIYLFIWALLSYLYLVHNSLKSSPFLLSFPILFFVAGLIPLAALLFIGTGFFLSILTIKYINPIILNINKRA